MADKAVPLANAKALCQFILCFRPSFPLVNALTFTWPQSEFLSKTFATLAAYGWTFSGSLWKPPPLALSQRFVSLDRSDCRGEQITMFSSAMSSQTPLYNIKFLSMPAEHIVRCFYSYYQDVRIEDKVFIDYLKELRFFVNVI